jgi:hypothetical protein
MPGRIRKTSGSSILTGRGPERAPTWPRPSRLANGRCAFASGVGERGAQDASVRWQEPPLGRMRSTDPGRDGVGHRSSSRQRAPRFRESAPTRERRRSSPSGPRQRFGPASAPKAPPPTGGGGQRRADRGACGTSPSTLPRSPSARAERPERERRWSPVGAGAACDREWGASGRNAPNADKHGCGARTPAGPHRPLNLQQRADPKNAPSSSPIPRTQTETGRCADAPAMSRSWTSTRGKAKKPIGPGRPRIHPRDGPGRQTTAPPGRRHNAPLDPWRPPDRRTEGDRLPAPEGADPKRRPRAARAALAPLCPCVDRFSPRAHADLDVRGPTCPGRRDGRSGFAHRVGDTPCGTDIPERTPRSATPISIASCSSLHPRGGCDVDGRRIRRCERPGRSDEPAERPPRPSSGDKTVPSEGQWTARASMWTREALATLAGPLPWASRTILSRSADARGPDKQKAARPSRRTPSALKPMSSPPANSPPPGPRRAGRKTSGAPGSTRSR